MAWAGLSFLIWSSVSSVVVCWICDLLVSWWIEDQSGQFITMVDIYIYVLAVTTCATDLLEKATFLQANKIISRYSTEALLLDLMGMILTVVLAGFVDLGSVSPAYGKVDVSRTPANNKHPCAL